MQILRRKYTNRQVTTFHYTEKLFPQVPGILFKLFRFKQLQKYSLKPHQTWFLKFEAIIHIRTRFADIRSSCRDKDLSHCLFYWQYILHGGGLNSLFQNVIIHFLFEIWVNGKHRERASYCPLMATILPNLLLSAIFTIKVQQGVSICKTGLFFNTYHNVSMAVTLWSICLWLLPTS